MLDCNTSDNGCIKITLEIIWKVEYGIPINFRITELQKNKSINWPFKVTTHTDDDLRWSKEKSSTSKSGHVRKRHWI